MVKRRSLAGFLAGVSMIATVLAIMALLLVSGGLFSMLRDIAAKTYGNVPLGPALRTSLTLSVLAFPGYIWSARWAFLILGLLGLGLAVIDVLAARVRLRGRAYVGLSTTIGLAVGALLGYQYSGEGQPAVILGLAVALPVAFGIWLAWSIWYLQWIIWLRAYPARSYGPAIAPPIARTFLAAQARLAWLKRSGPDEQPPFATPPWTPPQGSWIRFVLGGWAAATLLVGLVFFITHRSGPVMTSGELAVFPTTPEARAQLAFLQLPERVLLNNIGGYGAVDVSLRTEIVKAPLRQLVAFPLAATASGYGTAELDLRGLAPGNYWLGIHLRNGQGGVVQYQAIAAGAADWVGPARGFAIGIWWVLTSTLLIEMLVVTNWVDDTREEYS